MSNDSSCPLIKGNRKPSLNIWPVWNVQLQPSLPPSFPFLLSLFHTSACFSFAQRKGKEEEEEEDDRWSVSVSELGFSSVWALQRDEEESWQAMEEEEEEEEEEK